MKLPRSSLPYAPSEARYAWLLESPKVHAGAQQRVPAATTIHLFMPPRARAKRDVTPSDAQMIGSG
jgi:hypothetical protein